MFDSSLSPVVCGRTHVLFNYVICVCCPTHIVSCCCFVCLRLVSCVPYITSLPRLSMFYYPSMFSAVLFYKHSKVDGKAVQLFDITSYSCSKGEVPIFFRRVTEVIIEYNDTEPVLCDREWCMNSSSLGNATIPHKRLIVLNPLVDWLVLKPGPWV